MLTIFLLKKANKLLPEQGFTMLEVLVAILLITAFIATAMQLMVINVAYKVNTKKQAQSLFWVQEDQEKIMSMADSLTPSSASCTDVYNSYAVKLWKDLENETTIIASSLPGRNDTATPAIILSDTGSNFAHSNFQLQKPLLPGTTKLYKLQRTYKILKQSPDILIINYTVIDPANNDKLVQSNLEVKPNVYYQCNKN